MLSRLHRKYCQRFNLPWWAKVIEWVNFHFTKVVPEPGLSPMYWYQYVKLAKKEGEKRGVQGR